MAMNECLLFALQQIVSFSDPRDVYCCGRSAFSLALSAGCLGCLQLPSWVRLHSDWAASNTLLAITARESQHVLHAGLVIAQEAAGSWSPVSFSLLAFSASSRISTHHCPSGYWPNKSQLLLIGHWVIGAMLPPQVKPREDWQLPAEVNHSRRHNTRRLKQPVHQSFFLPGF
eukprot:m.284459 g.284459  ORF g.284459 m.284459 type:complete len:172 (-) comp54964_c1_seq60:667-1182(-)